MSSQHLPDPGTTRVCENCPRTFTIEPAAPHKRFCSVDCKSEWHNRRRKAALELLDQQEHSAPASSIPSKGDGHGK